MYLNKASLAKYEQSFCDILNKKRDPHKSSRIHAEFISASLEGLILKGTDSETSSE
jgi:hypothetical protein